ncbi:YraN family protein [Schaalia vaccimaxillae]|uniref:YraN family protein n=1 Tax=Schaalia vaccimaxillae TaxID=183916 RepID=UPI000427F91C|nr:YraN family protein [Schaalia vaccimaxillae]
MNINGRRVLGQAGEATACRIVQDAGLTVIERNWRDGRKGELDIIATDDARIIVIEVRTRIGTRCGTALESIDQRKLSQLRRLAASWAHQHHIRCGLRVDVIALVLDPQTIRPGIASVTAATDLRVYHPQIDWIEAIA